MARTYIRIGEDSFRKIREKGCAYVDKTGLIEKLLSPEPDKVSRITRPRRFGKTLTMSMLSEFFDIRKESGALFEGLAISRNAQLCSTWMQSHPVISLSLQDTEASSFADAISLFVVLIRRMCNNHAYLLESPKVSIGNKINLKQLITGPADTGVLTTSIETLTCALYEYWEKDVILLIDEYDVPLSSAEEHDYYDSMLIFIRNLFKSCLKNNYHLEFAVLTGCLRISSESIFTGLNNLASYDIMTVKFAEYFGFTENEVKKLLSDTGLAHKFDEIRAWYDGYCFGNCQGIFCPWDVLYYIKTLQENADERPGSYWRNSSSNSIIRKYIQTCNRNIKIKIGNILNNGFIYTKINRELNYDQVFLNEENFWTLLYFSGYLTGITEEAHTPERLMKLVIPNRELHELFEDDIIAWFRDSMPHEDREQLFASFWAGDEVTFTAELSRLLMGTLSCFAYIEKVYQLLVAGVFYGAGFTVETEAEYGLGRPDIVIFPNGDSARAAVIELKVARDEAHLQEAARAALKQIEENRYCVPLRDDGYDVISWGIATYRKTCLATART